MRKPCEYYQQEMAVNTLLKASLRLEKVLTNVGMEEHASLIRQMTSQRVLHLLMDYEIRGKVICQCGRWIRTGSEIEFYKNVCTCYNCDSGYTDSLDEQTYR